jgi:hypothetical protein
MLLFGLVHHAFEPTTGVDGRIGTVIQPLRQPAQFLSCVKRITVAGHFEPGQRLASTQPLATVGHGVVGL